MVDNFTTVALDHLSFSLSCTHYEIVYLEFVRCKETKRNVDRWKMQLLHLCTCLGEQRDIIDIGSNESDILTRNLLFNFCFEKRYVYIVSMSFYTNTTNALQQSMSIINLMEILSQCQTLE